MRKFVPMLVALLIGSIAFQDSDAFVLKTRFLQRSASLLQLVPAVDLVSEMPDPLPTKSRNKYYLLRHGQSTANVAEIISSSRSLAYTETHGLTLTGYEQGKASASLLLDCIQESIKERADDSGHERVVLISSPFARAKQTAEACLDGLRDLRQRIEGMNLQVHSEVVMQDNLVERYFGRLDGQAIYTYAYVWPLDQFNVTHSAFDVESVASVCHRIRRVFLDCEEQYDGTHLVLVSHADVLQIAQLYAVGEEIINVGSFSSYRFKNGEVRQMKLGSSDKLPDPVPLQAPDRGTALYERAAYDISRRERTASSSRGS